jgi:hypothetical protein
MVYARLFTQTKWCPSKDTCKACAIIVPRPTAIFEDLSLEQILLQSFTWKKERPDGCLLLRHSCGANKNRAKNGGQVKLTSNLFSVHEWCSDKINCKSCIQIVSKQQDIENSGTYFTPMEIRREVMRNFDFDKQKIICVYCGKEQTSAKAGPTAINAHNCLPANK